MRLNELFDEESFGVPTPSPKEVAAKHGVSLEDIMAQLEKGTKAELEHTQDEAMAKEIALDHLAEMPDYYDKLATIEPEHEVDETVRYQDVKKIEQEVDPEYDDFDIDVDLKGRHFVDRANDRRNNPEIEPEEIEDLLKDVLDQNPDDFDELNPGQEVVLHDKDTDLNVPVMMKGTGKYGENTGREELDMIAKTIMRKRDFRSNNRKIDAN